MLKMKVFVLLFFVVLTDSVKSVSRQNPDSLKRESQTRVGKRPVRRQVFENLFNVYDPSFLAVVWPKMTNGLHILVDDSCWEDLGVFFRDLTDGKAWAYTALDASGRYESALFSGNRFWLGSKEECMRLDSEAVENNSTHDNEDEENFNDVHEWKWVFHADSTTPKPVVGESRPPLRLAYSTVHIFLNVTSTINKISNIVLGVCLPSSCSPEDITSLVNFSILINDNLRTNKTNSRITKITNVRQVPGYYNIVEDYAAILLICITLILVGLAIVATIEDLDLIKCLPGKRSMTFDLEKYHTGPIRDPIKNEPIDLTNDRHKLGVENTSYMAIESIMKAPAITLDVNSGDRSSYSCRRCGKYRKQCTNIHHQNNLPPCPRLQYNSIVSLSTETEKKSFFCRLLLCFSLSYCWKRVCNTNTATTDLSLIHGMRIIATLWIIFLHVGVVVDYISDDAADINELSNIYYIVATGTIAFDTLFFVSGLFSSHHFFYLKSQYSVQELVGWGGVLGQLLQFICFVTNRVIRLLPPYAFAVFLSGVVARWSRSVTTLTLPDKDYSNCNQNWWRNLLYVNNLFPADEQCMQISWFLSTETQVHVVGALICAASMSSNLRARLCVTLALLAALAATVADASAAYFDFGQLFSDGFDLYITVIDRPWARVAPYFFGVFTGWMVHILQGRLKVSKITSCLLWISSFSFIFASVAVSMIGLPWLAAWLHLSWPIALLWPVIMGTTNLAGAFRRVLSKAPVAALSRLCYGMVLLHSAVARAVLLSVGSALCSQTICIWLYFAGTTILTLLASLLLSLLIEIPFCNLLRRLVHCGE